MDEFACVTCTLDEFTVCLSFTFEMSLGLVWFCKMNKTNKQKTLVMVRKRGFNA